MTDENDYSFLAEERADTAAAEKAETSENTAAAGNEAVTEDEAPAEIKDNIENTEFSSEHEDAPATAVSRAFYPETDTPVTFAYSTIPDEPKRKKKNRRFGAAVRRGVGFIAAAALFGGVAGGAFLGFNELYYYLNPSAKPSYANDMDKTAGGASGTKQPLISSTAVASGTSVATSDVSDIVEQAMPSLVSISCTFRSTTSFFGYLYEGTSEGSGSGIIVGKNDTELLIATNNHVVDDAVTTTVTFPDGEQVAATVRGTEEAADLAIVSVPLADIPAETLDAVRIATLGNSEEAKVGQMVIAIGNALGYGQTTTVGYLSAKEREITVTDSATGKSTKYTALQVDAAINPGNSGGALLNTKGEVIGINSAKLSNTDVEGIGYAIPINDAIDILNELMNREILSEDEQGYLGVYLSDKEITEEISKYYGFPYGVYIAEVVEGGAAANAGIVSGDIITAINGSPVTARTQLQEKVNSYRSGTEIEVTLCRLENGEYKEHVLTVTLGSKADFN